MDASTKCGSFTNTEFNYTTTICAGATMGSPCKKQSNTHFNLPILIQYYYFLKISIQIQALPLASTTKDLRLFKILKILILYRGFPLLLAFSQRTKCARLLPLMVSAFIRVCPHLIPGCEPRPAHNQSAPRESAKEYLKEFLHPPLKGCVYKTFCFVCNICTAYFTVF